MADESRTKFLAKKKQFGQLNVQTVIVKNYFCMFSNSSSEYIFGDSSSLKNISNQSKESYNFGKETRRFSDREELPFHLLQLNKLK